MHENLSEKQKSDAAGIVILKQPANPYDDYLVLCLLDDEGFDLPKGGIEPFETEFVAAIRETEEESGIIDLDFRWGMVTTRVSNVTLYIAVTGDEPIIHPNPETGEFEHCIAKWLTFAMATKLLRPYLRPAISWARMITGDG